MKNTISGFNQKKLMEFGLDLKDAMLLRYFVDFRETESMTSILVNGKYYYWLSYKHMKEDIPIIGVKSNDTLRRRLKKLEKCKILGHYHSLKGGSYSYYCLGDNYNLLIQEDSSIQEKAEVLAEKRSTPQSKEEEQNNLSTKDNNIYVDAAEIWDMYPNKKGKAEAMKNIERILKNISKENLKNCVLAYKEEIIGRDKKYILNGSTFFKGRYEDYLNEEKAKSLEKNPQDTFSIYLGEDM